MLERTEGKTGHDRGSAGSRCAGRAERRARFVERVLAQQVLQRFFEERLLAQVLQGVVVMDQDRIDALQRVADRILAEVVIEGLELEERDVAERPRRLVQAVRPGAVAAVRRHGADELHVHEAPEALVDDLGGHLDHRAQLQGGEGREAGLETAADREQHEVYSWWS